MGLRAGLEGCGKSRSLPGFDPRTVQPIAGGYTDCVIQVQVLDPYHVENVGTRIHSNILTIDIKHFRLKLGSTLKP